MTFITISNDGGQKSRQTKITIRIIKMIKTRFESGLGALMPSYSSSLTMDITASRYPWWGTAANYKPHAWSDWGEALRGSWCNWEAKMVLRKAFQISAVQRLSMRQMVFQPCWYSVPQTKPWAHFCCSFPYNSSWKRDTGWDWKKKTSWKIFYFGIFVHP